MALKKSHLYSSLWASCDQLRGSMDASQYKDYVLTLLFVKYVSDKYSGRPGVIVIPDGGSFQDMVRLRGDKEIGDKINKIIRRLAEVNEWVGVINQADFNDPNKLGRDKDMVDRLSGLLAIFANLDLRANRAEGDDLLGDAYEYLMRHFATEAGKSKGQFYTPAEVSRVLAKIVGIASATRKDQTVYDPTCGSGSLLIKVADEAPKGITIYGQEMDNATWALAKMNMILHGHPTAEIWQDNTLSRPHFKNKDGLKTFDFAVANPPFSAKAWSNGFDPAHDEYRRFEGFGIPPAKNGDYAFLLHIVKSLKSTGKAAVILPHGVLFRGNREADIRRNLVERGYIKGIIGLPANLFYGTGIPACVVVIDKEGAGQHTGIFMIDASRGFMKEGNKNRLRAQDLHKIVDVFNRALEIPGYSRMVPADEIRGPANNYNLNIPRYIDSSEPEDIHDLEGHLLGGIPVRDVDALKRYWELMPSLRQRLFEDGDRNGYLRSKVEASQVRAVILENAEFRALRDQVGNVLSEWSAKHEPMLRKVKNGTTPKEIISELSEDLLERFAQVQLFDSYDAYQRLMEYWEESLQDDVYLIAAEGWVGAARPRVVLIDKDRKIKEEPDLEVGGKKLKTDLIPPAFITARYFAEEQSDLDELRAEADRAAAELAAFVEESADEDGPLADAVNEKGKTTKDSLTDALKALGDDPESEQDLTLLRRCLELLDAKSKADKAAKEADAALSTKVLAKYGQLQESEIKDVVLTKWFSAVGSRIDGEVGRVARALAVRVGQLDDRYLQSLPSLERDVDTLQAKVWAHLRQVGAAWK